MLAIAHGSDHVVSYLAVSWVAACAIVTFVSCLVVIIQFVVSFAARRRITYQMVFCASLVRSVVPGLLVSYEGVDLGDPHVLGIELGYRGRGDIRGASFEEGRPFRIDVGVPVVGVIDAEFEREEKPLPRVEASGSELCIGPGLVRSGQVMRLVVLADGVAGRLSHESPLADVRVRQRGAEAEGRPVLVRRIAEWWDGPGMVKKVVTWALVLFIVYYLVSDPAGSAGVVHHAVNGLRSAGDALSAFVSSL
jgi:hypothetical protein